MRNYELQRGAYNQQFDRQLEIPMSWWLSIKDKYNYLCDLSIMIFSITPHSAGCERVFSTLGWLYGKRRQRLGLSKVEAMAKIRSFYISNIKSELAYVSQQHTEDEICEIINDSLFLQFEEDENEQVDNETNEEILDIPNHDAQVLIIESMFDLKNVVKNLGDENADEDVDNISEGSGSDNESNSDTVSNDSSDNEMDYDIEEVTLKYSELNGENEEDEEDTL